MLASVVAYTEYIDIITEYTNMHWVLVVTAPVLEEAQSSESSGGEQLGGKRDPLLSARLFS